MTHESRAAEWSAQPSMTVKGIYNSNLLLTPFPHQDVWGHSELPSVAFSGKTERLDVTGKAGAEFVNYYGGQDQSLTNLFFPLSVHYKTEQDALGFDGSFVRDNTLMSELLTTGLALRFTQRNHWTANPTWTHAVTERLAFQAGYQFSDVTYEDAVRFGLVDFQVHGGTAGLQYQATEHDQLQLTAVYTNFHTTNSTTPLRVNYPGAVASFTHSFSETLTGTISGGPRFVTTELQSSTTTSQSHQTVWLFGGTLQKQFDSGTVLLNANRDVYPSGFGALIQTDRVGVTLSKNLTETTGVSAEAQFYKVSGVSTSGQGINFPENRLVYLTPRAFWKFSEWWKVEVSYTHIRREADNFSQAALSHAGVITLTYFPPKLATSK